MTPNPSEAKVLASSASRQLPLHSETSTSRRFPEGKIYLGVIIGFFTCENLTNTWLPALGLTTLAHQCEGIADLSPSIAISSTDRLRRWSILAVTYTLSFLLVVYLGPISRYVHIAGSFGRDLGAATATLPTLLVLLVYLLYTSFWPLRSNGTEKHVKP